MQRRRQEFGKGLVEISAVDPVASMMAVKNQGWRLSPATSGIFCKGCFGL